MRKTPQAVLAMHQEIDRRIKSGESLNSIATGAEIAQPILYRWFHGQRGDISLSNAEKLIRYLGLSLTKREGTREE